LQNAIKIIANYMIQNYGIEIHQVLQASMDILSADIVKHKFSISQLYLLVAMVDTMLIGWFEHETKSKTPSKLT